MADYNINAATRRVVLSGSAGTGPYSFTFAVLVQTDLAVYLNSTKLTLTTDYTVSIAANGTGTVTLNTGTTNVPTTPTSSDSVIIVGARALERTTDFVTAGDLRASALNEQLDANVIFDQQLAEENQRTVKAPVFDPATTEGGGTVDMTLPSKDDRKGKSLAFNATTGNPEAGPTIDAISDAQTNATNAAASATAAAASATSASGSATTATTKASEASTSETNAAASATAAAASATAAAASETAAGTSETNAGTSATTATTKASEAATSATNAATSETNAATSATGAASSATAAASSATAAASSQTAAAASAASAASAFDNFDDTYLGSKTSDPTVDNDGDPLTSGDLYFNSTANEMRVYDGANWIAATSAGNVSLILYEYTATAGQTTFSGSDDNSATLSYTVDNLQVVMNGVVLDPADFTATNGTSVVLDSAATVGDQVNIYAFKSFTTADMVSKTAGGTFSGAVGFSGGITGDVSFDTNTLHVDSTNNNVGTGTTSPGFTFGGGFEIERTGSATMRVENSTASVAGEISAYDASFGMLVYTTTAHPIAFGTSGGEKMRLDASGNLLVGTTDTTPYNNTSGGGFVVASSGLTSIARETTGAAQTVLHLNTTGVNCKLAEFAKDGTTVGAIFSRSNLVSSIVLDPRSTGAGFTGSTRKILPADQNGDSLDNAVDLGQPSTRFDDIYATNGTIQTSDANEKQQIASLTDAEITAAKAISKLFKTYKWNDSVTENGNNARTHTGVIAQEVQSAMTDAGLDETKYAFWCSNTWWETQTEVPAVEADEENGIEAQDAYTRTDTYETAEEAPEGATERIRLGIRYPELLAFIGAATEQRLADIETRLTALEAE